MLLPSRRSLWSCSFILLLLSISLTRIIAQPAEAEESETLPWEKGAIQLGGFYANFNSDLTFGLEGGGNASIDGEDVLGLDQSLTVLRVEAMFRPGESRRHQLDFAYAGYDRDGSATLSRDLTIDGVTYPAGSQVDSVLNFDLLKATYSYAIVQNQRMRIALGIGGYAVPLKYGLEITTSGEKSAIEGGNTTLPLPTLALSSEFLLVPKLYLKASIDGMYLELSDFKGSVVDANLGLEYRPWKHLGLGVGYNFMGVHVETTGEHSDYPGASFVGAVDVSFNGLLFYGRIPF